VVEAATSVAEKAEECRSEQSPKQMDRKPHEFEYKLVPIRGTSMSNGRGTRWIREYLKGKRRTASSILEHLTVYRQAESYRIGATSGSYADAPIPTSSR
jgi:hypothetical protein